MSTLKKVYSLSIKQINENKYDNLYNSSNYIGTIATLLKEDVINDKWLQSDRISPLVIGKEVCAEYIDRASNIAINVPTDDLHFIVKNGIDYEFVKEMPVSNININYDYFNNLDGTDYSDLDPFYKSKLKYSEILEDITINEDIYSCYSFTYGGISKSTPYFFVVDNSNTIRVFQDSSDILIDYLEGYLYINKNSQYSPANIQIVLGLFDLEPVKVFNNKPLPITKYCARDRGYYQLTNSSDKLDFKIVSNTGNSIIMYFFSDVQVKSDGVLIDGIEELEFINVKQNEYLYLTTESEASQNGLIYKIKGIQKSIELWS